MYLEYLMHYGVKGMRWGVRRYQNPDGSLTDAGKKKYGKMSDAQLHKALAKQVNQRRSDLHGSGNRWDRRKAIGENSKKLIEQTEKEKNAYWNSDAVKKAEKTFEQKAKALDRALDSGKISTKEYDKGYNDATVEYHKNLPPKSYTPITSSYVVRGATKSGRQYMEKNFVNEGGAKYSVAVLKDLGYSGQVAEAFVERMARSNFTLAM